MLGWVALSPPVDLPDPGTKSWSLVSPALAGEFLTTESPGKPFMRGVGQPESFPSLSVSGSPGLRVAGGGCAGLRGGEVFAQLPSREGQNAV